MNWSRSFNVALSSIFCIIIHLILNSITILFVKKKQKRTNSNIDLFHVQVKWRKKLSASLYVQFVAFRCCSKTPTSKWPKCRKKKKMLFGLSFYFSHCAFVVWLFYSNANFSISFEWNEKNAEFFNKNRNDLLDIRVKNSARTMLDWTTLWTKWLKIILQFHDVRHTSLFPFGRTMRTRDNFFLGVGCSCSCTRLFG